MHLPPARGKFVGKVSDVLAKLRGKEKVNEGIKSKLMNKGTQT